MIDFPLTAPDDVKRYLKEIHLRPLELVLEMIEEQTQSADSSPDAYRIGSGKAEHDVPKIEPNFSALSMQFPPALDRSLVRLRTRIRTIDPGQYHWLCA